MSLSPVRQVVGSFPFFLRNVVAPLDFYQPRRLLIRCPDDGIHFVLQPNAFGGLNAGSLNDVAGAGFGVATGTSRGFYVITRTASNARLMYNQGSVLGNDAGASSSITGIPAVYALANNNNGTASQKSSDQIAVVWSGGSLDATNNSNLSADINAYMTALGTNVY